jgi:acylphosphatase
LKHHNITVSGRVQGVGFRFSAMEAAYRYNVRGFARNTPERNVYIEAEGEDADLERFVSWCRRGPVSAKVTDVVVSDGPVAGFRDFSIVH